MAIKTRLAAFLNQTDWGLGLGVYRIGFGLLLCCSQLRFLYKGWVDACFISPEFHFTYRYFHWVEPVLTPEWAMSALVWASALLALLVALGVFYRISIILFFLLFTYLELISQSWYLNHYYFVSIIAFLLIWMPADRRLSISNLYSRKPVVPTPSVFANVLRLQISVVYFFAGLAKINPDWLLRAQPLKIWLKARVDIPWIGNFLATDLAAYLFSYSGMLYDLTIPFLLWNKKSRPFAFVAVVVFHSITALLFPIGMFPWIMIMGSLIFIQDDEWRHLFKIRLPGGSFTVRSVPASLIALFAAHLFVQILLPMRHLLFRENYRWTDRNFRFGWNVMLVEKTGRAVFKVHDKNSARTWTEYPSDHLNYIQEKQMSFQADMIWQYAQFLKNKYEKKGVNDVGILVDNHVSFNGRPSQVYIPPDLDLLTVSESEIYDYVAPLENH